MRISIPKSAVAGLAALSLIAAVSVAPTPATAAFRMGGGGFGGGWHGGGGFGGGWHGGGGFGGGWRGGYGGGWRGGYGGYGYRRYGYGYGGWGYPGWGYGGWGWGWGAPWWGWGYGSGWGPDANYAGGGYYGGDNGCWTYRRVWTQPHGRGHYLGRRLVNAC
jgi:hypothetical protein